MSIVLKPFLNIRYRNGWGESGHNAPGALARDPHCGVESVFAHCTLPAGWVGFYPSLKFADLLFRQSHLVVTEAGLLRDPLGLVRETIAPVRDENAGVGKRRGVDHVLETLKMNEAGCEVGAVVLDVVWAEAAGNLIDGDAEVANAETVIFREGAMLGTATEVLRLSGLAKSHFVRVLLDA